MQITRQTEYAVRTLIELAKAEEGKLVPTKMISLNQNIPEVFLKKTIQLLANAGLIVTQRGTQGGIRLAVLASQITIADVFTAVEGRLAINVCLTESYPCPNKSECRVRAVLQRAQAALLAELSRESIADLIAEHKESVYS
jgi:Rrf2 family protein